MKKIKSVLNLLLVALAILVCMPSCFGDKDEVEYEDRCFISSFTLGSVKRQVTTTDSLGKDTTYLTTFSASKYGMLIDQKNLVIENADSLPYGTKVGAVLTTVGFTGVLLYKQADDAVWSTYSSSDSLDFTRPISFKVTSTSGNAERTYTVRLNVHQQDGDKCEWTQDGESAALSNLAQRRLVAVDDKLLMMAVNAEGKVVCASRSLKLGGQWAVASTSGADDADVTTLQKAGSLLLMSTTKGALLQSENGVVWTALTEAVEGRRLIGASWNCLYAVTNGTLESTYDGGATWEVNKLDDKATYLPTSDFSMSSIEQDNGYQRLVLVGNSASQTDKKAEVWTKTWRGAANEASETWMYYTHTWDNKVLCPQMEPLFALPYDGGLIALGGKSQDGTYGALGAILYSPDYGLTWREQDGLETPEALEGTTAAMAITVDADSFIWIVAGKQTWRGRLNRLGFAIQ